MGDEAGPTSRPSEPVHSYPLLFSTEPILHVIIRIRRPLELRQRVLLQLLHHYFNRLVELRIVPVAIGGRIEIDFNVRSDANILHFPFAFEPINRRTRPSDKAPVQQLRISANPHQPSPSLLANQRSEPGFPEVPRQRVAARA